ncbi:MAG: hypothetical protein QM758_02955 [Armatimonas sp.]
MTRRIAVNLVALATLGLILNHHQPVAKSAPTPVLQPLTIELRNVRALPGKTCVIAVDFVMKNNTKQPLLLAERWNSWGAYQWEYEITDATGKRFSLGNPQMIWFANMLTFFGIEPDSEFQMPSYLDYIQVRVQRGENRFVDKRNMRMGRVMNDEKAFREAMQDSKSGWKYPVTIVGKFTAKTEAWRNSLTGEIKRSNWAGTITTPPITVAAPQAP